MPVPCGLNSGDFYRSQNFQVLLHSLGDSPVEVTSWEAPVSLAWPGLHHTQLTCPIPSLLADVQSFTSHGWCKSHPEVITKPTDNAFRVLMTIKMTFRLFCDYILAFK